MFFKSSRRVMVKCKNPSCQNYNKLKHQIVSHIYSEEIKDILVCPGCGKELEIIQIKLEKT